MRSTLGRSAALLAVLALILAACSGSDLEPRRASGVGAPRPRPPRPRPGRVRGRRRRVGVGAPERAHRSGSAGKPGDVVIRWYCCLGTGDAPEQVAVEQQVAEAFNAANPGIHLQFEGYIYDARPRRARRSSSAPAPAPTSSVRSASVAPNAFHGQWLDLQPLIDSTGFDMSQYPKSTVDLYNVGGEGQVGIPYAIYPSVLFYKASLFKEAGLAEPPHEWNGDYTMPDGSVVPWDYDTVRKIGLLLTVDENGKDATEAGFDPENIVQWGFEPQRDDLRQTGAYWKAGSFVGRRWQDRPDPGRLGKRLARVLRRHLEGPHQRHRAAVPEHRLQPGRLPVLHRQGRDERELPVVDLRRRRRRRRLEHGRHPVLPGPDDGRLQRRHVPHPQVEQAPRRGVQGRSSYLLENRGPARAVRRHAGRRIQAGRLPRRASQAELHRSRSTGTSPRRASPSPTSRTSSRTCRPTTRPSTCSTRSARSGSRHPGLDLDAEIADLQDADAGHLGRRAATDRGGPQRRAPAQPCLASPGWPGGARAGGTSSSRRGSSGSSLFTALPMIATFVFTFTNINLAQAEPLRFVGLDNYADAARRPGRRGTSLGVTLKFAALALPGRGRPAVPRRAACSIRATCAARACSASCSSCRTSSRSWPAC